MIEDRPGTPAHGRAHQIDRRHAGGLACRHAGVPRPPSEDRPDITRKRISDDDDERCTPLSPERRTK